MFYEECGRIALNFSYLKERFNATQTASTHFTIHNYLLKEATTKINENFMDDQKEITPRMRQILISWLMEVQLKPSRKISDPVFFMAVNLIDRYLSKNKMVSIQNFQLLGIVCLSLANKSMNEIHDILTPSEIEHLCAGAFTQKEILKMEWNVFQTLDFDIHIRYTNPFLFYYAAMLNMNDEEYAMCSFLYKLSLLDHKIYKFTPALISFVCIYIVDRIIQNRDLSRWHLLGVHCHRHTKSIKFEECVLHIVQLIRQCKPEDVIYNLYASEERYFASKRVTSMLLPFTKFLLRPQRKQEMIQDKPSLYRKYPITCRPNSVNYSFGSGTIDNQ